MKRRPLSDDDRSFLANFRDGFVIPHEYEARLLEVIEALSGERWRPSSEQRSERPAGVQLEPVKACPKCGRAALRPGVLLFSCRNGLCDVELGITDCPELGKPHQWGEDDRCAYCGKTTRDHDAELAALRGGRGP